MSLKIRHYCVLVLVLLSFALTLPALASEPTTLSNTIAINTIWTLLAAFLVFFMQAGFAMLEAGFTRAKNAGNIVLKNLMDFCMATLVFFAFGFAIMFGRDILGLVGSSGFFLNSEFSHLKLGIPLLAFWLFQAVFAGTAATIVSGAMAERTRFSAYLIFTALITLGIYPVVGHWIWGGGWLSKMGFIDFAGSTVVHSVGAWAALAGVMVIGPRIGRFNSRWKFKVIRGHSITLAALGVFILWFGWFGFNAGSTIAGTDLNIARIAATTNLAAAAGAMVALFMGYIAKRRWCVDLALNGALAGLVAITAPTAFVSMFSAAIIGGIGGMLVLPGLNLLERLKIDDAVGAIPVHGIAGAWGTIAVGLFHEKLGLFFGGGSAQLGIQILGVFAAFGYTVSVAWVMFKSIDIFYGLRIKPRAEREGLDHQEHGFNAYPEFSPPAGLTVANRSKDIRILETDFKGNG